METQYVPGSSRQKLVLSLGRAERLDLDAARELARSITQGRTDVLTPKTMAFLPPSLEYGPAEFIYRTFDTLDLPRFWREAAKRTGAAPGAGEALGALTAYYLLSYQRGTPFFHWLSQTYVPGASLCTESALGEASKLLLQGGPLHPALESQEARAKTGEDWGFTYAVPCQYDFLPEDRPTDALFLLSGEDVPLSCRLWESEGPDALQDLLERSVFVTRSPELLARRGLDRGKSRFICAFSPSQVEDFLPDGGAISAFMREEGEFAPFREYGYRERQLEGLRAIILRSSSGPAAALTQSHREPRDIILTNAPLPTERILEKFLILDKVLDITHPVYLTEDLQFLRLGHSPKEILRFLNRMQLLQLFLCLYLGKRLTRCRTTLDDALAALSGLRCVPLCWESGGLLLTTPATPRQQEILHCAGEPHPFDPPKGETTGGRTT